MVMVIYPTFTILTVYHAIYPYCAHATRLWLDSADPPIQYLPWVHQPHLALDQHSTFYP